MSDKNKKDQLSIDAAKARACGMSYGKYMQWKALHTNTESTTTKRVVGDHEAVCRQCGKVFPRNQHYRVYCSRLCRSEYQSAMERREKYRGGLGV